MDALIDSATANIFFYKMANRFIAIYNVIIISFLTTTVQQSIRMLLGCSFRDCSIQVELTKY